MAIKANQRRSGLSTLHSVSSWGATFEPALSLRKGAEMSTRYKELYPLKGPKTKLAGLIPQNAA